jgi:hypothetical protein
MKATRNTQIVLRLVATALLLWAAPVQAAKLVHYTFDEAASGTTTAVNFGTLGSSANGSFSGSATRTSNTAGGLGALNLNPNGGNNDLVGPLVDLNSLDQLSAMTVTTWVNVQGNLSLPYYALASDMSAGNQGWELYYTPVGGDATVMKLGWQVNATFVDATANVTANNSWLFIAATWDGSTTKFYSGPLNGSVSQVGSSLALSATMGDNANDMRVGANPNATNDRTPNAFMDDFRVYNAALTLTELQGALDSVPEPSTVALLGVGALLLWRRR